MAANPTTNDRLQTVERRLAWMDWKLNMILTLELHIMATMTDLQAAVAAEDTVIDSVLVLLQQLAQMVRDTAPNQAALDALAASIAAKTAQIAEAVIANTPAAPSGA